MTITLDPVTQKNVDLWLNGHYDAETKAEIRRLMKENPKEVVDAFYTNLSFGTGGLRGIMGVGCNRMNSYTVRAATQGLANYLNKQPKPSKEYSVFIGYDSRHHSRSFAEESAKVLAGNGIHVYLFDKLRPTPLVSFGCRYKHCSSAIMITASHNPAEYNGYKVYWNDGAQILPPHDEGIIAEVAKITDISQVKSCKNLKDPLIEIVTDEIDNAYLKAIDSMQLFPKENKEKGKTLKIVYTSLHGTGITLMPKALEEWGFTDVVYVEKQIIPDGDFPTVKFPNPEEKSALQLGIDLLKSCHGDLLIATDPDADRVGVTVNHQGEITLLNGNQMACICLYHICEALTTLGKMPERAAFIKTIATTELFKAIVSSYKKPCFDVLTGFKYIAEKIREWEQGPNGYQYIFGGEESYGYLYGTLTRDKDAILSSALICEAALHAKLKGKTLVDLLHDIYQKYGFFYETLLSVTFEDSKEGKEQMAKGMARLQDAPPKEINGIEVAVLEDYERSLKTDLKTGKTEALTLPKSNVLVFWLQDGSKVMIRPSGTEPKIKIYCGITRKTFTSLDAVQKECAQYAVKLIDSLKNHLGHRA